MGPLGEPAPWRAEDSETAFLTDRFLAWLDGQGSRPWLAHVSFIKPHPPLVAAAPFHALVDPAVVPLPVAGTEAAICASGCTRAARRGRVPTATPKGTVHENAMTSAAPTRSSVAPTPTVISRHWAAETRSNIVPAR